MNAVAQSAAHLAVLRELAECPKPRRFFECSGQQDVILDLDAFGLLAASSASGVEPLLAITAAGREILETAS